MLFNTIRININLTLIILNKEMNDIIKMVKSLEEYELLIKGFKQLKMKQKSKKENLLELF